MGAERKWSEIYFFFDLIMTYHHMKCDSFDPPTNDIHKSVELTFIFFLEKQLLLLGHIGQSRNAWVDVIFFRHGLAAYAAGNSNLWLSSHTEPHRISSSVAADHRLSSSSSCDSVNASLVLLLSLTNRRVLWPVVLTFLAVWLPRAHNFPRRI